VLRALEVPGRSDWFAIGFGETRVTVRSQQVRVRVPAHRDHRFRGIVITQNGAS
jgi:hypothetical protein